jgi:bifunctional non-homologous end joining protein LigD
MVEEAPDKYVATITKSKRKGKILIDYFRNDYTATGIAAYSVRARPGMPVAVPLDWDELATLNSGDQFTMDAVLKRVERRSPWTDLPKQRLPKTEGERIARHGRKKHDLADGSIARRSIA